MCRLSIWRRRNCPKKPQLPRHSTHFGVEEGEAAQAKPEARAFASQPYSGFYAFDPVKVFIDILNNKQSLAFNYAK